MRNRLLMIFGAPVLCAAVAMAQSTTNPNNSTNPASSTSTEDASHATATPAAQNNGSYGTPAQNSTTDQTSPAGAANSTTNPSDQNKQTAANSKHEKNLKGCIVREQSDFFLQKGSKMVKLNSSEDLSAHVGHQVKVYGHFAKADEMTSSNTTATPDVKTSANASASTSADAKGTASTDAGTTGTMAASNQMPQSDTTATSKHSHHDKQFVVNRVDMVSDTCPDKNNNNSSTNNATNPR